MHAPYMHSVPCSVKVLHHTNCILVIVIIIIIMIMKPEVECTKLIDMINLLQCVAIVCINCPAADTFFTLYSTDITAEILMYCPEIHALAILESIQ